MTITTHQILLYAIAMAGLWAVPGPVWVALVARALSGGLRGALPLAVGVALGDTLWLLVTILGLSWVVSMYAGLLDVLRWVAAATFVIMGLLLILKPPGQPGENSRLTRPGVWAGFSVGLAAVIANPKAILFYMGFLPGFFDLSRLTAPDIVTIIAIATIIPMCGNILLSWALDRARALLQSPEAVRRMNIGSGVLLVLVGLVIPFT